MLSRFSRLPVSIGWKEVNKNYHGNVHKLPIQRYLTDLVVETDPETLEYRTERLKRNRLCQAERRQELRERDVATTRVFLDTMDHAEMILIETPDEIQHRVAEQQQNRVVPRSGLFKIARRPILSPQEEDRIPAFSVGRMIFICGVCGAKHFKDEKVAGGKYQACCSKGKAIPVVPEPCPELLQYLMTDCHLKS